MHTLLHFLKKFCSYQLAKYTIYPLQKFQSTSLSFLCTLAQYHTGTACADTELIGNVHFTHVVLLLQVQTQMANRVPNKTKTKQELHRKHWVSIYTTNTQLLGEGALRNPCRSFGSPRSLICSVTSKRTRPIKLLIHQYWSFEKLYPAHHGSHVMSCDVMWCHVTPSL